MLYNDTYSPVILLWVYDGKAFNYLLWSILIADVIAVCDFCYECIMSLMKTCIYVLPRAYEKLVNMGSNCVS